MVEFNSVPAMVEIVSLTPFTTLTITEMPFDHNDLLPFDIELHTCSQLCHAYITSFSWALVDRIFQHFCSQDEFSLWHYYTSYCSGMTFFIWWSFFCYIIVASWSTSYCCSMVNNGGGIIISWIYCCSLQTSEIRFNWWYVFYCSLTTVISISDCWFFYHSKSCPPTTTCYDSTWTECLHGPRRWTWMLSQYRSSSRICWLFNWVNGT